MSYVHSDLQNVVDPIHEVENANDCRDCFDIWCFLFHMTEEDCGSCLDVDLKFLMTILHYMSFDDTIESVVVTVKQILDEGDLKSLTDAVHLALEKHAKDILEKVCDTEKMISKKLYRKPLLGVECILIRGDTRRRLIIFVNRYFMIIYERNIL